MLPDLELGHHHQGAGEGQRGQQRGGGHEEHLADGYLGGLDTGDIDNTLLTSADDLGMQDVSVSVQGDQNDAGAAEEHGGALDTAHSLTQPALQQDLDYRDL